MSVNSPLRGGITLMASAVLVAGLLAPASHATPSGAPALPATPAAAPALPAATPAVAPALAAGPTTGAAARTRGYEGLCVDYRGVSVVVDFQGLGQSTVRRCALPSAGQTRWDGTGLDALKSANIALEGVDRWGMGFICRIQNRPAASTTLTVGGQPYKEQCRDTPPAGAYWSYWHSSTKTAPWSYSNFGVANRKAVSGGYEGWSFSNNQTAGTNPEPRVKPQVRPSSAPRPFNPKTPYVAGTGRVGQTLRVAEGAWSPKPAKVSYRWLRDGKMISGAWNKNYRITAADAGTEITVMVTATGNGRAATWAVSKSFPIPGGSNAGSSVVGSLATPVSTSRSAAPTGAGDAAAAADWMVAQLNPETGLVGRSDLSDIGLSIDVLWGLIAADPSDPRIGTLWANIKRKAHEFTGQQGNLTAGSAAKVLLAARTAGDGTTIPDGAGGSIDLKQGLIDLANADNGDIGPNPNAFGQSLAVMALVRSNAATTHPEVTQDAVDAMVRRQCTAGHFVMFITVGQDCITREQGGTTTNPDTDGTAMGLMAYDAAEDAGLELPDGAMERGLDYLESAQPDDGGFPGGRFTPTPNSNSTGLAAAVLGAEGRDDAAGASASWVAAVQADEDEAGTGLAEEQGAIAYSVSDFAAGRRDGLTTATGGIWRRATPQAVLAFAPAHYGDLAYSPAFEQSAEPRIAGNPVVGRTLIAYRGTWSPTPTSAQFRWLRDGREVGTGQRYTLTAADIGKRVTVEVVATHPAGTVVTRTSPATAPVSRAPFASAPRPTVKGSGRVGTTLLAYRGTWSPNPSTTSFRWMRDGQPIAYYGNRYVVSARDRGSRITVRVTGARPGYETTQRISASVVAR